MWKEGGAEQSVEPADLPLPSCPLSVASTFYGPFLGRHHLQRSQSLCVLPQAPTACRKHLSDTGGSAGGRQGACPVPHICHATTMASGSNSLRLSFLISERGRWVPRSSPHDSKAWGQQQQLRNLGPTFSVAGFPNLRERLMGRVFSTTGFLL